MTSKDLEFHIAQVNSAIKLSRKKFRSDRKKEVYQNLINLFKAIKKSEYQKFDITRLKTCRALLNIIYVQIEFLDYKYLTEIPFQIISCLNVVKSDWIDNPDLFSIVFSNNSKGLTDYYNWSLDERSINEINRICNTLGFNIRYDHGLIHISQPRFFTNDFLSSIPVYHELGHFIDSNYGISRYAVDDPSFKPQKYDSTNYSKHQLYSYMAEHFADLFSAQYLTNLMVKVLNFISFGNSESFDHPSTDNRISIIEAFISGTGTPEDLEIVSQLKKATKVQTKRKLNERDLIIREKIPSSNPFELDKQVKLSEPHEVHALYSFGWENFNESEIFSEKYPLPYDRLKRINFLIKKSIDLTIPRPKYIDLSTILPHHWLP